MMFKQNMHRQQKFMNKKGEKIMKKENRPRKFLKSNKINPHYNPLSLVILLLITVT